VNHDVLIVGSGHAGAQCAIALRQNGFGGSIALLGEEHDLPYERPPLSKDYLAGTKETGSLAIRPADFWREKDINLLPGRSIVALDANTHIAHADTAEAFGYGKLVWAAGGHARQLGCRGSDLPQVHSIRTRADVEQIPIRREILLEDFANLRQEIGRNVRRLLRAGEARNQVRHLIPRICQV